MYPQRALEARRPALAAGALRATKCPGPQHFAYASGRAYIDIHAVSGTATSMPLAKLSRAFYDKFGDALTDELVNCLNSIEGSYRAELRDLFDGQVGRFEDKLERRLGESRGGVTAEMA